MLRSQLNNWKRARIVAACALSVLLLAVSQTAAQTAVEQAPSLKLVPGDSSVYAAVFHNKDVYENVVGSKAYAKVAEIDAVKEMLKQLEAQWREQTGNPAIKGVVAAVIDALSNEIFFYTDSTYVEVMNIYQEANAQGAVANIKASAAGEPDSQAQLKAMLDVLADHVEELRVPDMVIGMRVTDPDVAKGLVAGIKEGIKMQLPEMPPEVQRSFKEETVGDVKLITFKFDGSMIPWGELPLDDLGEPGKYDALVEKFKSMTLAISMGVKDEYLLISIGDTNEHIGLLGKGEGLAGRPEFARLAEIEGKKLRSISYASKEAAALTTESALAPFMAMLAAVPVLLPDNVDDMLRKRLAADAKELAQDLEGELPKPGAMLSVSTFSPRGFDTLSFNWSENVLLDSSKPLTLLNHLGRTPIAFAVARGKHNPKNYQFLLKWLKKADGYANELAEQDGGEDAEKYKKFRTAIGPLLARLDVANREKLMPALADGQTAIVLDAQMTGTKWFEQMPESPQPLPMLEVGMVVGVSDAKLLKQGCREYFAVANEAVKILHEMGPEEVPIEELPAPQKRKVDGGAIWYYLLPKEWGVDDRIAPNAGVSKSVAALSIAPLHTKRLLEKSEPILSGPVAQYKDKPIAAASGFNFAALVDAAVPWVEYGMTIGPSLEIKAVDDDQDEPAEDDEEEGGPGPDPSQYIETGAELLKCFRGTSSVTYVEDGVTITRGEWHFQDLE